MSLEGLKNKKIHFSAIGGIGMSAIAKLLHELNFNIVGSDLVNSKIIQNLKDSGVEGIKINQISENIDKTISLIVRSSAIRENNPEMIRAKELKIPVIKRADMLANIMAYKGFGIALGGTHGKTSMTAMVAAMLEAGKMDPTVINGGIINAYGTNAKLGRSEYCVVESDESDGSFVDLPAKIIAISNIEPEHMDFYKTEERLHDYFLRFIKQAQAQIDGLAILCIDDPEVRKLIKKLDSKDRIVTYAINNEEADIQAKNIKQKKNGLYFDIYFKKEDKTLKEVYMPMYGTHNVQNVLTSIAIAKYFNFSDNVIRKGLEDCTGVQKRFTNVGEVDGITIIDDYGHHPSEIKATIKTAKSVLEHKDEKVIVVFQPHRYTRVRDLFDEFCSCFGEADVVIVTDIYSANQTPIKGITQDALIKGIEETGHKNVIKLKSEKELAKVVSSVANSGDLVLCTGAGTITYWARALANQIKEIR